MNSINENILIKAIVSLVIVITVIIYGSTYLTPATEEEALIENLYNTIGSIEKYEEEQIIDALSRWDFYEESVGEVIKPSDKPGTIAEAILEDKSATQEQNSTKDTAKAPTTQRQGQNQGEPSQQQPVEPPKDLEDNYLNKYVLDIVKTYEVGVGKYPYLLNQDYQSYNGVTKNIYYNDQLLLKAHPSGSRASHCSGITFEVFFRAMERRNRDLGIDDHDFNGMSFNQLNDFVLNWYVALGPKINNNVAVAVEKYGIGERISNFEDVRSGDFIDFSRENGTGHTAVFINWVREDNRIIGFRYWSSQQSTRGINYNTEYFNIMGKNSKKYGNVMANQLYIARVVPVSQYSSLR